MTEQEAKLLEKLDELSNDLEVDMYSVATLNFFFEECAKTIRKLNEELQQYRALGTLEELKEAKETQIAKKPILDGPHEFIRYWHCPDCKGVIGINQMYCDHCGKAIDWGNEDDT